MNDPATPAAPPVLPLTGILTAISDLTRWRILDELLKGEPLPVKELARRLGVPPTNISKHCILLCQSGIILRGFGNLFKIPAYFLIPGQRAVDLGAVVLHLDRLDG